MSSQSFWRKMRLAVLMSILTPVGTAPTYAQKPDTQRPFRVDDLFELEGIGRYYGGPYAFSRDGQRLAITRSRPGKTRTDLTWFL